ncbi:DNA topoisomerase 1 [Alphaproteobacteria bacterium]
MKLLIVESPAKAKTINKYLGSEYEVLSSAGHVRSIPSKARSVRPEDDFDIRYEIIEKSTRYLKGIIASAKKSTEIYLATDPDREGEAISWHIAEIMKQENAITGKKVKRIVFYEITPTAIKDALINARDLNMDLIHAQQARQALDYLVGFTLSPILWRKLPGSRSAGRVQSVALRIICAREAEIRSFKIKEYWSVQGIFYHDINHKFMAELAVLNGKKLDKYDITNAKEADAIVQQIATYKFYVGNIEKKVIKRTPPPPFTTSTLIQEAAHKLGFSARKTAQVAQKLYEGIEIGGKLMGLITYMRTDSVAISTEAAEAALELIRRKFGNEYALQKPRIFKNKIKNAQEAHEAIRPTNAKLLPEDIEQFLERDQLKLYSIIWRRLVASQMKEAILESTTIDICCKEESGIDSSTIFKAKGTVVIFPGFHKITENQKNVDKKLEEEAEEGEDSATGQNQFLPKFKGGEDIIAKKINPIQHFTQPPARYTEASLVKKMEALGIGRPSTYPTVISILLDRQYVNLSNKAFIPEERGELVDAFLISFFNQYVQYDFTAKLEDELDDISNGKKDYKQVLSSFWQPFKYNADSVMQLQTNVILNSIETVLGDYIFNAAQHSVDTTEERNFSEDKLDTVNKGKICPSCEIGELKLKNGKFGSFLGCSRYPECKHTRKLAMNGLSSDVQSSATKDENKKNVDTKYPVELGIDKVTQGLVTLNSGPYGFYLRLNSSEKKSKTIALPKNVNINEITLEYAERLLEMPCVLAKHPGTGEKINIGIGRYGPYVEYQKKYYSIKNGDIFTLSLDQALELIAKGAAKSQGTKSKYTKAGSSEKRKKSPTKSNSRLRKMV